MTGRADHAMSEPVLLAYPFTGRWMARNSPARRIPSHGTHLMGTTYAIDFIRVDGSGRSGPWDWRSAFASEPPERFVGFGTPVLAPVAGTVTIAHDGEPDHVARRSLTAGGWYLLGQAGRARAGPPAIAGNHVVIAASDHGPYVLLAHLRRGSLTVREGDRLSLGQTVGQCGNSGNSIQPHVHVQATVSTDWAVTRGLPIRFQREAGPPALPEEGEIVDIPKNSRPRR